MLSPGHRIPQFYSAVGIRFEFLLRQGFGVVERTAYGDRWAQVQFERGSTRFILGWDAYSGELNAEIDGASLWPLIFAEGLWDAGRDQPVYMGYAIEAMEHGLERVAALLKARPQVLGSD